MKIQIYPYLSLQSPIHHPLILSLSLSLARSLSSLLSGVCIKYWSFSSTPDPSLKFYRPRPPLIPKINTSVPELELPDQTSNHVPEDDEEDYYQERETPQNRSYRDHPVFLRRHSGICHRQPLLTHRCIVDCTTEQPSDTLPEHQSGDGSCRESTAVP